jgi:hypothetical protein
MGIHPTKNEKFDHCHLCLIDLTQNRMPFTLVKIVSRPRDTRSIEPCAMYQLYQDLVTPALSSPPPMPTIWRPRGTHTLREKTDVICVFVLVFTNSNVLNDH